MKIQLLWFRDCPNHEPVRTAIRDLLRARGLNAVFEDIDATEPAVAVAHRFPGSPTVRVNGEDVEPGSEDHGDYTPRCRLYLIDGALKPTPSTSWIEAALEKGHD